MSELNDEGLPGLAPRDRETLKKVFSAPLDVPREWKAWLRSWLEPELRPMMSGLIPAPSAFVGASVSSSGTQSIANNTSTAVAFGAADTYDTDSIHDPATNNTRLTAPVAGKYLVIAIVEFTGNITGFRQVWLAKNGVDTGINVTYPGDATTAQNRIQVSMVVDLAITDYVELFVFQNSGGALNINSLQAARATISRLG